jgi:hypothetical protein
MISIMLAMQEKSTNHFLFLEASKMKKRINPKSFNFESLEKRWAMAGNVSAAISGKSLTLTGDDLANNFAITGTGIAGQVLITGAPGTTINGSAAPLLVQGITSTIHAKLKGGDDIFTASLLKVGQDLIIEGNQGRDTIGVYDCRIGDDLLIYTHENNDIVTVCAGEAVMEPEEPAPALVELPEYYQYNQSLAATPGSGVYVGDQFEIDAGAGSNFVEVCYTQVNGNTFFTAGGSNDRINVYYVLFNKNVNVFTNGGSDTLNFSYYIVKQELKVDTATGHDYLSFYNAIHNGAVNIFTGANNDQVYIGQSVDAEVALEEVPAEAYALITNQKNFFLDTNSGYDTVSIADMLTKGNVTIQTGSEGDEVSAYYMINYKDVVVDLGSGNDFYRSQYGSTGGNFLLLGGSGIDSIASNYDGVNKKFTIDLGEGNDIALIGNGSFTDLAVFAGSGDDAVFVFDTLVVKKASFDGGSGKDRLDRTGLNSFGSQSVVGFEYLTATGPL